MGLRGDQRLRSGVELGRAVRHGQRTGSRRLVVHLWVAPPGTGPAKVGFVVSKAVGGSVVRHRVTRQLRALVASRYFALPDGGRVVIRVLPPAAGASSDELGADLDRCFNRLSGSSSRTGTETRQLSPSAGGRR